MGGSTSLFREGSKTYQTDRCGPLAMAAKAGEVRLEAVVRGYYPGKMLPDWALPGITSLGFWDAKNDQDWGLDWHRNEGIEITMLETGHLPFYVDDHSSILQPDDLTVTRPWQPHRVGAPNVSAGRLHFAILDVGVRRPNQSWTWPDWVVLTESDKQELTDILRQNEQPVWRATPEIRHCFQQVARGVENYEDGSTVSHIAVYLNALYLNVLAMLRSQSVGLNPSLSGTRRTIDLFLSHLKQSQESLAYPWTLRSMAEECGMGVTIFVRHCKQLTNMTPVQYLNYWRVKAAEKKLQEDVSQNISEIAFSCGFASSEYFSTVFRREHGVSPKQYRNKFLEKKRNKK